MSGTEHGGQTLGLKQLTQTRKLKWNLMSYFYIRQNQFEFAELMRDCSEEILIDSGAHSFQKGKKVDWDSYTEEYAEWIKRFDRPNVIGYFEMDVDNIIGYKKVVELRHRLERVTDKIIPVWHKNRGIDDFKRMCQEREGKIIAITGFKNEDIQDDQYPMFLKFAKKFDCKVHCLGMTRKKVLDKVPFDYTDSASWCMSVVYGRTGGRRLKKRKGEEKKQQYVTAYLEAMEMQEHYYQKWKNICKD